MRRLYEIAVDRTADNILTAHALRSIIEVFFTVLHNWRKIIICKLILLQDDDLFVWTCD